jgi:hypothetical protein
VADENCLIFYGNYFRRLLEINFGGYSHRCRRKLFGPIFGGYAQAAENIIVLFSAATL